MSMNREIFRLAVPNIVSNITVPLMGLASTAIAGRCGNAAECIGALAVGVAIFNFLYWNFSFLRMGTSGITAQAFGAGDFRQTTLMLFRAVLLALALGLLVIVIKRPIGEFCLWAMHGNDMVAQYFYTRIWAVPAGIMLFGLFGWLTGMQNAIIPMTGAIFVNVTHVIFSFYLAFSCSMGVKGIALASVIAQWSGLALVALLLILKYGKTLCRVTWKEVMDTAQLRRFFTVNTDIIIRTFCLCTVYTFFTGASSRMGADVLAVNSMLLQLFTLFSYMSDGFAYATEALTGRFKGAKDAVSLKKCVRYCTGWMLLTAAVAILGYIGFWKEILGIFVESEADAQAMIEVAGKYVWWVISIPAVSALPFLYDGMMVGVTMTSLLRRTMVISTVFFYTLYFCCRGIMGNDALWMSFTLFMLLRGVLQYVMSHGLKDVYRL